MIIERVLPVSEPVGTLADYVAIGGGEGLAAAREHEPEWVLGTVAAAGLRERSRVGLPAAATWERESIVIAPGSVRDRFLIGRNPYQVLEGLTIAAFAVGASQAVVAVHAGLAWEGGRLYGALDELCAAGLLGPAPVRMVLEPRSGACDVETLAHVPEILRRGPEWFRANETMVFSVSGNVCRPGVFELPIGISVRLLVELAGGGGALAVVSEETGAVLTGAELDLPISVGCGGFVVYDDQRSSREFSGTAMSTLVPSPGRERMVSDPPISSARSAMLFSP